MKLKDVLKRPIITEKSIAEAALAKYTFEVSRQANKTEIKRAIEEYFHVQPISVKTMVVKGKTRRARKTRKETKLANWKKAIVTLKEGQKIEIFEVKS